MSYLKYAEEGAPAGGLLRTGELRYARQHKQDNSFAFFFFFPTPRLACRSDGFGRCKQVLIATSYSVQYIKMATIKNTITVIIVEFNAHDLQYERPIIT